MQSYFIKVFLGLFLLLAVGTTHAQTKPKVVVIPMGGDVSSTQFDDLVARVTELENNRAFVVNGPSRGQISITDSRTVVNQVSVTAPSDGRVFAIASGTGVETIAGEDIRCALSTNPTPFSSNSGDSIWEASGATTDSSAGEGDAGVLIRSDTFSISAGQTQTYYFSCQNTATGGASQVWGPKIQAIFLPE